MRGSDIRRARSVAGKQAVRTRQTRLYDRVWLLLHGLMVYHPIRRVLVRGVGGSVACRLDVVFVVMHRWLLVVLHRVVVAGRVVKKVLK